jgi:hypothetical protein
MTQPFFISNKRLLKFSNAELIGMKPIGRPQKELESKFEMDLTATEPVHRQYQSCL